MKSLLIIDTPKSCGDCPCIHDELWMCQADKEYREGEYSSVPLWCPLIAFEVEVEKKASPFANVNMFAKEVVDR